MANTTTALPRQNRLRQRAVDVITQPDRTQPEEAVMADNKVFKVGDRVEQMCLTCGEERGHVVASLTQKGKVTRVSCPICGSRVPFKSGATARVSTKAGAPYDRARTYRRGQTIVHPNFGEGEVTAIIETGKMDVLFADRMRRLIHSEVQAG